MHLEQVLSALFIVFAIALALLFWAMVRSGRKKSAKRLALGILVILAARYSLLLHPDFLTLYRTAMVYNFTGNSEPFRSFMDDECSRLCPRRDFEEGFRYFGNHISHDCPFAKKYRIAFLSLSCDLAVLPGKMWAFEPWSD